MTRSVWKFPVGIGKFGLRMPQGSQFLHVDTQGGEPHLWALVDPTAKPEERHFEVFGTGHPIDDVQKYQHIGTFQMHGGALVFHLFEKVFP